MQEKLENTIEFENMGKCESKKKSDLRSFLWKCSGYKIKIWYLNAHAKIESFLIQSCRNNSLTTYLQLFKKSQNSRPAVSLWLFKIIWWPQISVMLLFHQTDIQGFKRGLTNLIRSAHWSSPSVGTFFPISEFSYFIIRFLN